MKEFITEKGTKLFYGVQYSKGGYNHFTGKQEPRAYSVSIQRLKNQVHAFKGLDNPSGAVRVLLNEVSRKSKKQEEIAYSMITDEMLQEIANKYYI